MNRLFANKSRDEYSSSEWMCIKISIAFFWLTVFLRISVSPDSVPYPVGVFSLINGSFLVSRYTVPAFSIFAVVLALFYIREKWMRATTFLMFLLSLVLFTLEESNGFLNRHYLYTAIFFSQFIAYYRNSASLKEERIQFPIQIIAGGYMLAGISKLKQSGLGWVTEAPMVSIQILKGYCYDYFNNGNIDAFEKGIRQANFIAHHKYLAESLFAASLLFELFAWLAVKNKFTAFIYGLLLLAMHIGISYFMNILIGSIFFPMFIFMVNPLYFIYRLANKLGAMVITGSGVDGQPVKSK